MYIARLERKFKPSWGKIPIIKTSKDGAIGFSVIQLKKTELALVFCYNISSFRKSLYFSCE